MPGFIKNCDMQNEGSDQSLSAKLVIGYSGKLDLLKKNLELASGRIDDLIRDIKSSRTPSEDSRSSAAWALSNIIIDLAASVQSLSGMYVFARQDSSGKGLRAIAEKIRKIAAEVSNAT